MIKIKEVESYKDYGKVISISNDKIEAYVTVDVGPRIVRFGYVDGQNFMQDNRNEFIAKNDKLFEDYFGKNRKWELLGGHRIWVSPESYPESYYPDNIPISYELTPTGGIFTPKEETENGLAKQLEIRMDENSNSMQVIMRVKNISKEDKKFSIWGLTVSAKGGNLIIPMNTNDTQLFSNRIISVWPYTDLSDERIFFGKKYTTLSQDSKAQKPIKLGFDLNGGTVHYVLGNEVFTKSYKTLHPTANYPDGGCSFETYSCAKFIEVESLGEYKIVKPDETSILTENWSLSNKPCEVDFKNNDSIDRFVNKI